MCDSYEITLGNQTIGTAQVSQEGLYYRFYCRCSLTEEIMYRLKMMCGDNEYDLGILVPVEEGFGINTKLPAKTVGKGILSFYVQPRHPQLTGHFIPIRADEPFAYLDKLQRAYLDVQDGIVGVIIEETEEVN